MPRRAIPVSALFALISLMILGCQSLASTPTPTPAPNATEIAAAIYATQTAAAPTATATARPTDTPEPTPTGTPTRQEIFERVSPAIAFIESPADVTGSGVLIPDGYIVTNAHVVWPANTVRVVFPNEEEFEAAPVVGWDLMGDIAVIGPVETDIEPVRLGERDAYSVGSDSYLIGYPGEVDEYPQPTLARGVISRERESAPINMTYLQTDAAIAGGQSGGILVGQDGTAAGISTFTFAERNFGLVAAGTDVMKRVNKIVDGESVPGIGSPPLPTGETKRTFDLTVDTMWDDFAFIVDEPPGEIVEIAAESEDDVGLAVLDAAGFVVEYADDEYSGTESLDFTVEYPTPYFLLVRPNTAEGNNIQIRSSHDLARLEEQNPYTGTLSVGDVITGTLDYPADNDFYSIDLMTGDMTQFAVDSIATDPFVSAGLKSADFDEYVSDDDSGKGLHGLNAELVYQVLEAGSHHVVVESADLSVGGYVLRVETARPGATPQPTPEGQSRTVETDFGDMTVYEDTDAGFSIQYPADWRQEVETGGTATRAVTDGEGRTFVVTIEDLEALGLGEMTLDEYADIVLAAARTRVSDIEVLSRKRIETETGQPALKLELSLVNGRLLGSRFIYLKGQQAFNATYTAPADAYEALQPLIEYSFSTFAVEDSGE